MSARRVLTHDLARSRDLESFRDGLPGLAARDRFRHKARKIAQFLQVTNAFSPAADVGNKMLASDSQHRKLCGWKASPLRHLTS